MMLTGENQRTGRKTCPTCTLSTKNSMWTGLGSNLDYCRERSPGALHGLQCTQQTKWI